MSDTMDKPKMSTEMLIKEGNFGSLRPYLHFTDNGATLVIYKCIRFDCDYISPEPGLCKNHRTELVMFVFVEK